MGQWPPVAVLQRVGTTLRTVRPFLDLVAATFDLLAWDYRGLGRSAPVTGPYTMADLRADAAGLVEIACGDSCRLLGVSFGGMVAQEFAVTNPERVERLALACTSAGGDGGSSYPLQKLPELPPEERAAVQLKLADSRWDERWFEAHPADRALTEGLTAAGQNHAGPQPPTRPSSRPAQAMTYGTASTRSPARPWLATATTTGSRRSRTAPRSHRASAEPSCAATKEGICSCSRTRPRYRNSRHSFKRRRGNSGPWSI